jgi:hypothetical protein
LIDIDEKGLALLPVGLANINAIPERTAGGNLRIKSGAIKADYFLSASALL